jgi:g-D-glutamyl-meso-diaminopimelate peptidase
MVFANHPHIHTSVIGHSRLHKPLYALRIGDGQRKLLFNASHHANEWITTPLLIQFIEDYALAIPEAVTFYAVPVVNPDGVEMVLTKKVTPDWKANAYGVDLNANYPAGWEEARKIKKARGYTKPGPREYMGPYPLSEPESRALADFTRKEKFDVTVSLHTQGEEIYWRYGPDIPPGSRELAEKMAAASGYALEASPDESAHAGYKDWFISEFARPGYTVECGLGENPLPFSDFYTIYPKVKRLLETVLFND